ncbi:hypothetical protein [Kitasatospora sp. LaBMicrA B282]|uniref:hypothetical protein n=1 Tax=Kitasatospora sp. LaBMicrA B282 TaxID=3420949 RepID=UPI003D10D7AD
MNILTGPPHHGPVAHLADIPLGLSARFVRPAGRQAVGAHNAPRRAQGPARDRHIDLVPVTPPEPATGDQLLSSRPPGDRGFILGGSRREWSTVKERFGDAAWTLALELVRAGIVTVRCEVADDLTIGAPVRWYLTTAGRGHARLHHDARDEQNQRLTRTLERARADIASLPALPEGIARQDLQRLDEALAREKTRPVPAHRRIAVLTALADDLCLGTRHTSTRAFSLAHTRDTKTWDDADRILRDSGVPATLVQALGLHGRSRIGLGGPITATPAGQRRRLDGLGVVLLPTATSDLHLQLRTHTLIMVENLQAADALYRALEGHPQPPGILYHAGMPSREILQHIAELGAQADRIIIAPDADLGGTRIATAIWNSLPLTARNNAVICDVGQAPGHTQQDPWPPNSPIWQDLQAMLAGPAASLAQGCLRRGYPVEQEGCIVDTVLALIHTTSS